MKTDYLLKNNIHLLLLVSLAGVILHRFFYIGDFASTWDQVDFALALDYFDLRMMQPHFPGYPIFIWGGMVVNQLIADPVQSLVIFNKIMIGLSAIPMFLIAKNYFNVRYSLLFVLFWQSLPYLNLLSSLPMSEGAAFSMVWWFIWSVLVALKKKTYAYQLLPLFLFSLLLGIRLSYIAFGILLIGLWFFYWRRNNKRSLHIISFVFFAALFQLIWIVALVVSEGSLQGFLSLAFSFTGGHFTEWGGAITDNKIPLIDRFILLITHNVLWVGLAVKSTLLALLLVFMILLTGFKKLQFRGDSLAFYRLFFMGALAYFLWALFAQNIDKPRHIAPLILFIGFWISLRVNQNKQLKYKNYLIIFIVISQLIIGNHLMKEQQNSLPATYQLAHYIESQEVPSVLFAWEEIRTMDYLNVEFSYQRVWTYELFIHMTKEYKQKRIYLTNHVLEGFEMQGITLEDNLVKRAEFFSNELFDPTYHHIILYEWKSDLK